MKVGITTFYYHTYNYGANLQAFALCKVINDLGFHAEQLRFEPTEGFKKIKIGWVKKAEYSIKTNIFKVAQFIRHPRSKIVYYQRYKKRCRAVDLFCREYTPHSKKVYTAKNIHKSIKNYDGYVTGSDVVWSPKTSSSILFLRFVPSSHFKLAYAPSLGTSSLTEDERILLGQDLRGFHALSTREKSCTDLISSLTGKPVEHCLDSTLLLSRSVWENITSTRLVSEKYVFCYFLGNNKRARELAVEYATVHNLRVVNISYYWDAYKPLDDFGDVRLYDVSPADFLSLIRYSDCVFTDSFHACVFSQVFETPFFAFRREVDDPRSIRIWDFLNNTGTLHRYIDTDDKESFDYVNQLFPVNYNVSGISLLNSQIDSSIKYLKLNLEELSSRRIKRRT